MLARTIFDLCTPRDDVARGAVVDADLAADLAKVLNGSASPDYQDPVRFFAQTHPTRGLKQLLQEVLARLADAPEQQGAVFRLDTTFGGGKTHGLIALAHAAAGMKGVPNIAEFVRPDLVPTGQVRVAAFDGENADPANGRSLGDGRSARTPWGEIAFRLKGGQGFERVRRSDETGTAPGAETLAELMQGGPCLILLDELGIYLRKAASKGLDSAAGQLTAFLTSLFRAVETTPGTALVFTLAIGKDDGRSGDAYANENERIAKAMAEAASVSARKATLLDPTGEDETVHVLRRRLFGQIDDAGAAEIVAAYRRAWTQHAEVLPQTGPDDQRAELFRAGYPFHPELMEVLKEKTSTLQDFQRVRGMLRLLGRAVAQLWQEKPKDTFAFHLHHLDPGHGPIRRELTTRLKLDAYVPAIMADVAAVGSSQPALAAELDARHYAGQPPYATHVARTILWHSFAFNENVQGVRAPELRYAVLAPGTDPGFVDDALRRFQQDSAYLDDRPNRPLCFRVEPNLTQLVRHAERNVDREEARRHLNDKIRTIFAGKSFELVAFPYTPGDIPDDGGDGRPTLVVMGYDACVYKDQPKLPDLVRNLFQHAGSQGQSIRLSRNNLVFLVVDEARAPAMLDAQIRWLGLQDLSRSEKLKDLPPHQQQKVQEWYRRSETELATNIQQAYRHLFSPGGQPLEDGVQLSHASIDLPRSAAEPGSGQRQVVSFLRSLNRLLSVEDNPPSPVMVRAKTQLNKGRITVGTLRIEFRRNPALPMLVGDDIFRKLVTAGVEQGEWIYRRGDLVWAKGLPRPSVEIDEQSELIRPDVAREEGIWPKPERPPAPPPDERVINPGPNVEGNGGLFPGGAPTGNGASPQPPPPPPPGPLSAEGSLREALVRVFDKARAGRHARIARLTVEVGTALDAMPLIGLARLVSKAERQVKLQGDFETTGGATCIIEFDGPLAEVDAFKEFLEPQLRASRDQNVKAELTFRFDDGLSTEQTVTDELVGKLTRAGAGAAFVEASVQP